MNTFEDESKSRVESMHNDAQLQAEARSLFRSSVAAKYSYNFFWLGRPIIQYPQDISALQEIIWAVKPDLIIETGIAHGGSLVFSASLLALIDYCEAVENQTVLDPSAVKRKVLGIDIDIRSHNRAAIEAHPMSHRIKMIEGSSIAESTVREVYDFARGFQNVLVILDSNHTHDHVLAELEAYAPLTSSKSYCVVFDTVVEDLPENEYPDRPWGPGNNPKTAVWEYLRRLRDEGRKATDGASLNLEIDSLVEQKLLLTVAPDGYLRRI